MPTIKSLAHACVYSSDLARTEAFYCGALGLKVHFRFLKNGKPFGFYLRISDLQFIEVFYREPGASPSPAPPIGHICLETDDIPALRQALLAHGVNTTEPKLGADQSWQMWTSDPDGTPIEFHQYTERSCQYSRQDCLVDW